MALIEALRVLNNLKRESLIGDYAICGGYAVIYYLEPSYTYDLDILVLLKSDADYYILYKYFKDKGNKIENVYIIIEDMPVQFLPSYLSPLFEDAIRKAKRITVKGVPSKVVRAEHLIALLLVSFRPKDRVHIGELLKLADKGLLDDILARFADEKTPFRQRLRRILENL